MRTGAAKSLSKEDPGRLLAEYEKPENAQHLPFFCQHYLNALHQKVKWNDRILRFIKKKYGPPADQDSRDHMETPFWAKVEVGAKKAFKTWLMLVRIDEFFEGVRADFWRHYVKAGNVVDVKKILNGDGFMLDFGKFGVVEFKNIGNAAYIYPTEVFRGFWKKADYVSYGVQFKDRIKTIRHRSIPGWGGRIIHKGNWQDDTSSKIRI
ncbi:MAG: hypothetical protein JRJ31_23075, partial [Deltaproteobacteria bacterium]|nr:hypothetical protein [Deltaproteobacteria bacterium]